MSDRTRRVAFTGAAVLLLALALLLNRRGSDPADGQRAQAPSSPVIERSPTPPTPSRTVQPATTRAVRAGGPAPPGPRPPGETGGVARGGPPPPRAGAEPRARRHIGRRTSCRDRRARLHARVPALQLRPRRRRADQRRSAAARACV